MISNTKENLDYFQTGNQLRKQGEIDEAIHYYRLAITKNSNHFYACLNLGICLNLKEKFGDANTVYAQAINLAGEKSHNRALCYYNLGLSLFRQGNLEQAINAYNKAIEISPNHANSYHELANIFAKKGDLVRAIKLEEKAQKINGSDPNINYALTTLKASQENLNTLGKYNYKIISLGGDCLPRTILTKWGIKPSKAQGELSCPFDLSVHSYSSICQLLKTDFQDYLNLDDLQVISRPKVHYGIPMPKNTKYNCIFNHERGEFWVKDNFQNLINRYQQRISNFNNYINSNPVLFVFHDEKGIFTKDLSAILHQKYSEATYKLLVINTSGKQYEEDYSDYDNLFILNLSLPTSDYRWSLPKYYTLATGIEFEDQIQSFIKELIIKHFPTNSKAPQINKIYFEEIKKLQKEGKIAEVIERYKQAIAVQPNLPIWVYQQLGNTLKQNGQTEEAIPFYQQAIKNQPNQPDLHLAIAQAYFEQNNLAKVIEHYQQAIQLKPNLPFNIYKNLEKALKLQGEDAQAAQLIQSAPQVKEGKSYGEIWQALNQINLNNWQPDTNKIPSKIEFAAAEQYFSQTSEYKIINVTQITLQDQTYLENLGLSVEYLKANGARLITQDGVSPSKSDYPSVPSGFDQLHWQSAAQKTDFQASIIDSGCIYALCPTTGKVLSSNRSLYGWQWTRGGMIFYRFVGEQVFYLITGGPWGQKCSLYFPNLELLAHISPVFDFFPDGKALNGFKAQIVATWQQVRTYLTCTDPAKTIAIVGQNENIGHYASNILSGVQKIYELGKFEKIDQFFAVGSQFYGSLGEIFPEIASNKIKHFSHLPAVCQEITNHNYFAVRIGDLFVKKDLAKRIHQASWQKSSSALQTQVLEAQKKHFPLLWITIRTGSRSWISQAEGISQIINALYQDFPQLGIVFNGFSRGEIRIRSAKGKDEEIISREQKVIQEIQGLVPQNLPIYNLVGKMMHECIVWVHATDLYLGPWGATMTNTLIANKPGIIHTNKAVLKMPLLMRWGSWERENAIVPVYIPEEEVIENQEDAINKSCLWDTRPTLRKYDFDWQVVYREFVNLLTTIQSQ